MISSRLRVLLGLLGPTLVLAPGCSSSDPGGAPAQPVAIAGGHGGVGGAGTTGVGGSLSGGTTGVGGSEAGVGGGSAGAGGNAGSATGGSGGTAAQGGSPADFWGDTSAIPMATNALTFAFLNRTNGVMKDSEVFWRFDQGVIHELHSIAEKPFYDMPANASGRMYFYVCPGGDATCLADPSKSNYFDFIEHTIGPTSYNGNTTRVDAFGLKISIRLHCADGFDRAVGEDYETFAESRDATFAKFGADVPAEFAACVQTPHRIVAPGAAGFGVNGAHAHYYDSFVDALWTANAITVPKPGPDGSGLASFPALSAAIFRHVGATAGTFDAQGKLLDKKLWADASTFYQQAPAN